MPRELNVTDGFRPKMLEKVSEGTRTRGITFTTYTRQADAPIV